MKELLTPRFSVQQIVYQKMIITSLPLNREVTVECWFQKELTADQEYHLLLINDGQMLMEAGFPKVVQSFLDRKINVPLFCVGIHAGKNRLMEYGTMRQPDYAGRGALAKEYAQFVLEELLPFLHRQFKIENFRDKTMAGFSLGGLSALDLVWNYPQEFARVGIFSGSLWWRNLALDHPAYRDDQNRIMHIQVKNGGYYPWLRFFFECGTLDEQSDRNGNGIIDSIDDTLDLITILKEKGYSEYQLFYHEIEGGKHDALTWGKAWPVFLDWAWKGK